MRQYITINQPPSVQNAQQNLAPQGALAKQNLPLAVNVQPAPVRHEPLEDTDFAPQSSALLSGGIKHSATQEEAKPQQKSAPPANSVE
ncbi:MAG: hypothetical protein ACRC9T_00620, partial [Vibrionaceae bacterium]